MWANRFIAGQSWGAPVLLESSDGDAFVPNVAVDANGSVAVVWYQLVNGRRFIFSNRFTTNAGWGAPAQIETHTGGDAILPTIAMDRSGNALAVWQQEDDFIHDNAYAARFTVASGWGVPQALKVNTGFTNSGGLHVVIDPRGDALALWSQQVGSGTFSVLADRLE
jgi:hypothetical protein